MRKLWVLAAVVVALVGYAGYRMGKGSGAPEGVPRAVQPGESAPAGNGDGAPETAPSTQQAGRTRSGHEAAAPGEARPAASESPRPTVSSYKPHYTTPSEPLGPLHPFPTPAPGSDRSSGGALGAQGTSSPSPANGSTPPSGAAPPGAQATPVRLTPPGAAGASPPPQPRSDPSPTPSPTDDPSSDKKPPTLQYLRFDPPQVKDGGMSTLTIGVTDDLSGVKSVFGTLRSPSEAAVIPFVGQDAGATFTVNITIPLKGETGEWFVGTLQILDKADNPLYLAYTKGTTPQGGTLHVDSAASDSTPPTVRSAVLDKQTVAGGDRNRVVVDVADDQSGVASVTGTFQNQTKSAFIPFTCTGPQDGPWAGDLQIPKNADCGEWSLRQIRAVDKANNAVVVMGDTPELGHVSFFVASGGGCDSDPPVLDALYLSPGTVSSQSASTVVLTITAHDDGSGLASVTGRVEGPPLQGGQVPRIYFSATPDGKNPTGPMTATLQVPALAGHGIWRVTIVELTDKARNTKTYTVADPLLANAYFTVQ